MFSNLAALNAWYEDSGMLSQDSLVKMSEI